MDNTPYQEISISREIGKEILLAVSSIRYGSVEVTVQDSAVVQIEIKEKVRFEKNGARRIGRTEKS
jgi:hypothetical protein